MRDVGRYRILERIASGGMAEVYRAEVFGAEGVRKEVALKVVRADHLASPALVARFVREARLAARLSHANVVQVFEFGEADGRHFIAMELVRGHHLARVVERAREAGLRFGPARAVFVAAEVATALAYAHQPGPGGEPGLVHRDVSPHNVLVSWEGEVKLADFGIARAEQGDLTVPGTLEGKLAWVAPEQARGEPVDGRADLFSLGVVLWELLTGARLFARETEAATLEALLRGPAPSPPSGWNEGIPPALDALVLACLDREPGRRPASAREVADQLRALLVRMAASPREWELRPLMRRLWPAGEVRVAAPPVPTVRRPPTVAEPRVPLAAEAGAEETRVLGSGHRAPWRRSAPLFLAALAVGGVALGAMGWRARRSGAGETAGIELPRAGAAEAGAAVPGPVGATAPRAGPSGAESALAPSPAPTVEREGAPRAAAVDGAVTGGAPLTPRPPAAPGRASGAIFGLPLPPPASGEGVLAVDAAPWAALEVDGHAVGDTPRELRLAAGLHRVRVEHPRLGSAEAIVKVVPGRRTGWYPRLVR